MSLELVGEATNTPPGVTPATSTQVGYLSYVVGLKAFKGKPENETTALFTFYAQLPTVRVISDGPLRIITRLGKFTIYRDLSANSRFGEPDTFRDGRAHPRSKRSSAGRLGHGFGDVHDPPPSGYFAGYTVAPTDLAQRSSATSRGLGGVRKSGGGGLDMRELPLNRAHLPLACFAPATH